MPKMTLSAIEKRIASLQKVAEKLKKKDRTPAIRAILVQMRKHGVTLEDLKAAGKGNAAAPKQARKRSSVAAKYRHPGTGATWSGRGRTPIWIVEAEKAGQSRDSFAIK